MPTPTTLRPQRSPAIPRVTLAVVAVAAVVVHLLALYWPVVSVEGPVAWTDKVVHLTLFAVPTYAVGLAVRRVVPVAVVFLVHAPASELVQATLLPNRSGDVWDVVLNVLGVGLAVAGLLVVRARSKRW